MMIMMYRAVYEREKRSRQYSTRNNATTTAATQQQSSSVQTQSRKVAAQAMLYVLATF